LDRTEKLIQGKKVTLNLSFSKIMRRLKVDHDQQELKGISDAFRARGKFF